MAEYSSWNGHNVDYARVYTAERMTVERSLRHRPVDERINLAMQADSVAALQNSVVTIVGCGTLGGPLAHIVANKGYGTIYLCDPDYVAAENLATQVFTREQLDQPKAFALAEQLVASTPFDVRVVAVNDEFRGMQSAMEEDLSVVDLIFASVDSGTWRGKIAEFCHERCTYVTGGLSRHTHSGWVFWSAPGMDILPDVLPNKCQGYSPGCIGVIADASHVIAGLMTYVADYALLQQSGLADPARPLDWQYRRVFLSGYDPDQFVDKEGLGWNGNG